MKKTKVLLLSSIVMANFLSAISIHNYNNFSNEDIVTEFNDFEGKRIKNNAKKFDSVIDFTSDGDGEEYISNVKTQYAAGTKENTSAIRFVAAVKGVINSFDDVTLPGTFGFHVSYLKEVNGSTSTIDYMYDVDYIYHSISASSSTSTTYYCNEVSSYYGNENSKTIADWLGTDNTYGYNLFIALKLDNIDNASLNNIISVQPYLKLNDVDSYVTSSKCRFTTVSDTKELRESYFVESNNKMIKLNTEDGSNYSTSLQLEKDQKVSFKNQYGVTKRDDYVASEAGEYNITFKKDVDRFIVSEPVKLLTDFSDRKEVVNGSWGVYLNEGVTGKTEDNFDSLKIVVDSNPDKEAWWVKLDRTVYLKNNVNYLITYYFESSNEGLVKVNGEERFASNGLNVVHKRLVGADADQYLFIELGALGESFTVNFTKIEICEIEDDFDYEGTISNFTFNGSNVYANFDGEGSCGSLNINQDSTSINIEKGPSTSETWRTKLTISLGKLIVGEYYKISFDVVAANEQGNVEVLYGQGDNEKELGEYYSQTISTNVQTFTHVCQIKNSQDAFIRLMLGSIGNNSNIVTVTNVKVSKQIERKIENTQDVCYYRPAYLNMIDDSGTLSYNRDTKVFNYNISSFGEYSYSNKLEVKDVAIKKDAKYSIEFKASSDKDITIKFLVSVQGGEWKTLVANENVTLNSETNTYTYSFEVLDDDIVVDLLWEFGGEANSIVGSSNVSISDIKVLTQNYA